MSQEENLRSETDIIVLKKLSPSLMIMQVKDRTFKMREMSIGQLQKFLEKLNDSFTSIQRKITEQQMKMKEESSESFDLKKMDLNEIIIQYGNILFQEMTNIFNFVFSYKNEGEFDPVNIDWVKENISIRVLKDIALGIAEMNNIKDVLIKNVFPFFQDFFQREFLRRFKMGEEIERKKEENMKNGKSIIK